MIPAERKIPAICSGPKNDVPPGVVPHLEECHLAEYQDNL